MRLVTASTEPSAPARAALDYAALDNGVRYAALHRPGADVTTVSVWILAGFTASSPSRRGASARACRHAVGPGRAARAGVVDEIEAWVATPTP